MRKLWGLYAIVLLAAIVALMAFPVFGFNLSNTSLTMPQLTVRFAPNPGSFAEDVSGVRTGIFGFRIDEFPEPIPPTGYTFIGWFSDGEQLSAPIVVVRSTTILAGFAPIINAETISGFAVAYNPGTDGRLPHGTLPIQSFTYGSVITSLPVPVRDGYYFAGWQSNGYIVSAPLIIRSDMTLEAVWYVDPPQLSSRPVAVPDNRLVAVFNPFPGTFRDNETGMRFARFAANLEDFPPDPVRQGYTFKGWRMPDGETLDMPLAMRGDIMLTAIWEQNITAGNEQGDPRPQRPNPQTSPITISLMIFIALMMLGGTIVGIYMLNIRHATANSRYRAYITRCVREMKIVIKNRK